MSNVKTGIEIELQGFNKFIENLKKVQDAQDEMKANTEKATQAINTFGLALSGFGSSISEGMTASLDTITKSIQKFIKAFVGFKNIDVGETELKNKLDTLAKAIVNSAGSFDALNKAASNVSSEQVRLLGESVRKFVFAFDSLIKLENFNSDTLTSKLNEIKVALDSAQNEFRELGNVAKSIASSDLEKLGTSLKAFTDSIKSIVTIKGLGDLSNNLKIMSDNILKFANSLSVFNASFYYSKQLDAFGTSLKTLVSGLRSVINIKDLNFLPITISSIVGNMRSLEISLSSFGQNGNIDEFSSQIKTVGEAFKLFAASFRSLINIKDLNVLPINISSIVGNMRNLEILLSSFGQNANIDQFSSQIKAVGEAFKLFAAGFRSLINIKNFDQLPVRLQEISNAINELYRNLGQLNNISGFYTDFDTLAKAFQRLAAGTRSLVNIRDINKLPQNITYIVDALSSLQAVDIENISRKLEGLAGPLKDLASAARALKSLEDAKKAGNNLRDLAEGLEGINPLMKAFIFTAKGLATLSFNVIRSALPHFIQLSKVVASFTLKALTNSFQFLFNILIRNPIAFVVRIFQSFVNVIGNVVRALGNLVSFVTRLGGIFNSSGNSTKRQSDTLQDLSNNTIEAAQNINTLANNQNKANSSVTGLNSNFQTLNNTIEKFQPKSFSIFGRELDSLNPKVLNLAAALTSLNVIGNVISRTFQSLSNNFRNVGNDAVTAIKNAENLQLQISVLQARELVQTGQFDDVDAAMVTAQENATKLISDFKILAQITPFETNDLVAAFKQLQTFGFLTDDAVALTKIIATVPGITGDALREIAVVFGQIRTSGKLSQQDLRQLTDRGIDVGGAFQKAFQKILDTGEASGVMLEKAKEGAASAGAAIEVAKEGFLSTDDAITAIATSIGQDFAGSLALSANTTEALFSSLKSLKDELLVNLFSPTITAIKPFINDLILLANQEETINYIKSLGESIGTFLGNSIQNIINVVQGFIAIWRDFPDATKETIIQFAQFAAIVTGITLSLAVLQGALGLAAFAFAFLVNPVSIIVGLLTGLVFLYRRNEEAIVAWIDTSTKSLNNFASNVQAFVELLYTDFEAAMRAVVDFGSGLIRAFVDGIISAFNYVATAMQQLGNLIAFWLQPGSPPRVLPDIDKWGTAAANEFLQGFTIADFNNIKDFGATVGDLLESINIEGVDTKALTNLFANAINEINVTGSVDLGSVFESIDQIVPQASTEVKGLAEQYLNVIKQTKALSNATTEYSDAVNGLNALNENETLDTEQKRIQSLQEFAKSQFITDDQRKNSLNQIAKIQQGQLIRQAEKQLKQAEEELDATKTKIDLANQFKNETQEASDALEDSSDAGNSLKDKLEKAGKAAGDIASTIGSQLGGLGDIELPNFEGAAGALGGLGDIIAGLENPLDGLGEQFETAKKNIENAIKPIITLYDTLRANSELVVVSLTSLALLLGGAKLVGGFTALKLAIAPLVATVGLPALALGLLAVGAGIIFANTEFGKEKISSTLTNITDAFESFERAFTINDVYSIVDEFVKIDLSSVENMGNTLGINASIIKNRIETFATGVVDKLNTAYLLIKAGVNPLDALALVISNKSFEGLFTDIKTTIRTNLDKIVLLLTTEIPTAFSEGFNDPAMGNNIADKIKNGLISAFTLVSSKFGEDNPLQNFINNLIADLTFEINNSSTLSKISADIQAFFASIKLPKNVQDTLDKIFSDPFKDINFSIDLTVVESIFTAIGTSLGLLVDNLTRVKDVAGGGKMAKLFGADTELEDLIANIGELIKNVGTITGAIAGFVGLIGLSIIPELPGILNNITELINGVLTLIIEVSTAIGEFLSGNKTFTETLETIFGSFSENFTTIFNAVDEFAVNIADIFQNIITIIQDVTGTDLSGVQSMFDTIRPAIEFLISGLVLGGIGKFLGLFGKLGGASLVEKLLKFKTVIVGIGTGLVNAFTLGIATNMDRVGVAFDDFISKNTTAKTLVDSIISIKDNMLQMFTDITSIEWTNPFTDLDGFVDDLILLIKSIVTTMKQNALDVLEVVYTNPFVNLEPFVQAIIDFISNIYDTLSNVASTLTDIKWTDPFSILVGYATIVEELFTGLIDSFAQLVADVAKAIFPDPFATFNSAIENTKSAVNELIDLINKIPGIDLPKFNVAESQNNTPTGDANDFSDTLAGLNAGSAMVERGELSLGEFDSVVEKLREAGLATGEGFLIGFEAGSKNWGLGLRTAGDDAVKAVKEALGIKSPSKVMMDEVGKPMAEGLILGFKTNFKASGFTELFTENITLFTTYYSDVNALTVAYYENALLAQSAFFTTLVNGLTTFFSDTFTSLTTFLDNSTIEINNEFAIIISIVTRDLAIILGLFTTFMSDVLTALTTFMSNVSTKMYEIVGIFNGSITAAIAEFVKVINETMYTNISNAIISVLGSLSYEYVIKPDNAWQKIGDDMAYAFITGMVNGITKRIRDVIRTVQKLVQDSLDAGKKALEASSPSKLTQREIGEPFSQGIALGIANGTQNVENSIDSLLDFSNIEIKNYDYALKKLENVLIVGVDNILKKLNDNLDLFVNSYESVQNNLVPNEIFDTSQNSIVQQSDRLSNSLLSGLDSLLLSNQRSSDISTRNITQQSSNSFVRSSTRNYNLYLSVDENQYTNVNKNFKVMEYLGI